MNMKHDPAMHGALLAQGHEGHAFGRSGQGMERIGQKQIFIGGDRVFQQAVCKNDILAGDLLKLSHLLDKNIAGVGNHFELQFP